MVQDFGSVSDHFGMLCIKGLKLYEITVIDWLFLMNFGDTSFMTIVKIWNDNKYSRMDQVKFVKGFLPQVLHGSLLNALS